MAILFTIHHNKNIFPQDTQTWESNKHPVYLYRTTYIVRTTHIKTYVNIATSFWFVVVLLTEILVTRATNNIFLKEKWKWNNDIQIESKMKCMIELINE